MKTFVLFENEGAALGEDVGLQELTQWSASVAEGRVPHSWSSYTATILMLGIYGHSRTNSVLFLITGLLLPYLLKNPAFLPYGCYYCGVITYGY